MIIQSKAKINGNIFDKYIQFVNLTLLYFLLPKLIFLVMFFLFLSCDTRPPNTYLFEILVNNPEKWNEEKKKTDNFKMPRDRIIFNQVLDGMDFSNVIFAHVLIKNVKFINCNFKSASFYMGDLQNVSFIQSEISDTNWVMSNLKALSFTDSNLDRANFSAATLEDVVFDNVSLHHGDFAGATIKNVLIKNSMLNNTTIDTPKEITKLVVNNSDLNQAYWRILIDVDITINNSIFCNLGRDFCEKTGTNTKDWNNKYYKKIER